MSPARAPWLSDGEFAVVEHILQWYATKCSMSTNDSMYMIRALDGIKPKCNGLQSITFVWHRCVSCSTISGSFVSDVDDGTYMARSLVMRFDFPSPFNHRNALVDAVYMAVSRLPMFSVFGLTVGPEQVVEPLAITAMLFVAHSPYLRRVHLTFTDASIYDDTLIGTKVLSALLSNPGVHSVKLMFDCSSAVFDIVLRSVLPWITARHLTIKSAHSTALGSDVSRALVQHTHIRCLGLSYCAIRSCTHSPCCGQVCVNNHGTPLAEHLDILFGADSRLRSVEISLHGGYLGREATERLVTAITSPTCSVAARIHVTSRKMSARLTGPQFVRSQPADGWTTVCNNTERHDLRRVDQLLATTLAYQRMHLFERAWVADMRALTHLWCDVAHPNEMQRVPFEVLCYLFDSMRLYASTYAAPIRIPYCVDV